MVNKNAYSLLKKKFLEFLISLRRLWYLWKQEILNRKPITVFTSCMLAKKKNKNKRSAGVLNGVPCVRFESKGSAKMKCFSVSETLEPKPEYDKKVQRKQS